MESNSPSGDVWQKYVDQLLNLHYAHLDRNYQRVPATNGDCGLEGFTPEGDGYQSYSDQKTKTHEERTKKQKSKINRDLNKLKKHRTFWSRIFDLHPLRCWIFVVPNFDEKMLLPYCKEKACQMKASGLSFISSEFEILVKTDEDFPDARCRMRDPELANDLVSPPNVSDGDVRKLEKSLPDFVSNVRSKLKKAMPSKSTKERAAAEKDFLKWHLKSENITENLRRRFPDLWEKINELADTKADSIHTASFISTESPNEKLIKVLQEFEESLKNIAPNFPTESQRTTLSWGYLSKWLGYCNLRF